MEETAKLPQTTILLANYEREKKKKKLTKKRGKTLHQFKAQVADSHVKICVTVLDTAQPTANATESNPPNSKHISIFTFHFFTAEKDLKQKSQIYPVQK